ncbi:hypothetical protein L1987_71459 [Smallanthus sonchifolius]|uniref:Uncharacterized protein n=1 Tax=Smallanthus sonchifolius TaxID=185202 RepID=A0ACB9ATD2_9ASTR|nr:hypothetical protein L1987_71459 [Smallanthus sonchifolius]
MPGQGDPPMPQPLQVSKNHSRLRISLRNLPPSSLSHTLDRLHSPTISLKIKWRNHGFIDYRVHLRFFVEAGEDLKSWPSSNHCHRIRLTWALQTHYDW